MRGLAGSRRGSAADAAAGAAAVAGDQAPGSPKPPQPPPPVVARDAPVEEVERFIAVTVDKVLECIGDPNARRQCCRRKRALGFRVETPVLRFAANLNQRI